MPTPGVHSAVFPDHHPRQRHRAPSPTSLPERSARRGVRGLLGLTDRADVRLSFGELFRCWQRYKVDEQGNLIDDEGEVYAHISEFEDDDEG